jgi:hypothetical protein
MSLNWSIEKVADWKELTLDKNELELTQAIVFETMVVGIGQIREGTWAEFKARSDLWRTLDGEELIPAEAIKRRIGLSTNVSPETSGHFAGRIAKAFMQRTARRVIEEAAPATV